MPSSNKAPKDPIAVREAKLAEALRANLRRRKADAATKPDENAAAKRNPDS